ncbi:type IV secretion system protein B4 [Paracoccus sp. CPCC 101403]|uniref:Type IV secretion system protein B4 n=1 Tax=Paracoccus broussonetiae TaxID=3075834 RepID=A0ABU3EKS7_9RHOB|nr:type IV secretion system protein B4 [Paracoccus sp. CPCC 101403]MDT1064686.1 type IV secretion system protein B4 [Paracoccus sp. CPCC 101403]
MFDAGDIRARSARATAARPKFPQLYPHMPYVLEVDDHTVRSRENALMMSLEVRGKDGFTSAEDDLEDLRRGFAAILDGLDERFSFYVHRMMKPAKLDLAPIHGDSFAADLDARWSAHLAEQKLRDFVLVLTVVRNLQAPLKLPVFARKAREIFDGDSAERHAELREVVTILETSLPIGTKLLRISNGSLLGFYASLNSGVYRPEYRGDMTLIAEDVSTVGLRFRGNVVRLTEGPDQPRYAAVLAVKNYPTMSEPGMLDALDTGMDTLLTHSYTPIARQKIADLAKLRIQQMRAAGDAAGSIEDQLATTYDDVESGRLGFGEHQFTITVFADSPAALETRVSQVRGVAEQARIRLTRLASTMEATFFANHPGNRDYQAWESIVSSITFADLCSLHMTDCGLSPERLPWKTPITVFQTVTGAAHRFSFHDAGDPKAEPSIGHTLILGPSNSGKTATLAFLAAQARRSGARIVFFDKDQGLRMAIAALGGRYAEIKAGQPTGLNPLVTENGPRGEAWLMDWLATLAERGGETLTPQQADSLKQAVRQNGQATPDLRTFQHFTTLIGDARDNRALATRIAEWGPEGRYNWVFGAAGTPVVDFAGLDVLGIDLTEILGLPSERSALLTYIFRRLELMFEARERMLLIIDEASTVFDDEFFARWLPKWLVTVRKMNVVVVLLTQFPSQIRNSRSGAILEGLPTQILFPNRRATPADYQGFGLSDAEIDFLLAGRTARRQALLRSHGGQTILDVDLSTLGPLLTALGGGEAGRAAFGADYQTIPFFWRT